METFKKDEAPLSVLFVLLLELKKLDPDKRILIISEIERLLVREKVVTTEKVVEELNNFRNFVDSVSQYMKDNDMSQEEAVDHALFKYPQFGSIQLN